MFFIIHFQLAAFQLTGYSDCVAMKDPGGGYYILKACVAGGATTIKCKSCRLCSHTKLLQQYLSESQDGELAEFKAIVDGCLRNTHDYTIECLSTMAIPFQKASQLEILPRYDSRLCKCGSELLTSFIDEKCMRTV